MGTMTPPATLRAVFIAFKDTLVSRGVNVEGLTVRQGVQKDPLATRRAAHYQVVKADSDGSVNGDGVGFPFGRDWHRPGELEAMIRFATAALALVPALSAGFDPDVFVQTVRDVLGETTYDGSPEGATPVKLTFQTSEYEDGFYFTVDIHNVTWSDGTVSDDGELDNLKGALREASTFYGPLGRASELTVDVVEGTCEAS